MYHFTAVFGVMDSSQFDQNRREKLADFVLHKGKPLIVILGPTAGGKTSFSLSLADFLEGLGKKAEVVNADSRQIYRGLNIGTAKITPAEMNGVPHHLIDVLDPSEEVTAPWFKEQAEQVIDDILRRGNIPVLVGGSMLYISAIIDGLHFAPIADDALRSKLEEEYDLDQGATLYARLQEIDPDTAANIHSNNKPYVIRAMELCEATGAKASSQKEQSDCTYDLLIYGMEWPREAIVKRINERVRVMLRSGWIDEVRTLVVDGHTKNDPAMKSHGYKEIMRYLEDDRTDIDLLAEEIAAKTRQYAKRQMTWWRHDPRIHWIAMQ